ncbi:MAG: hypothetical protein Q7R81_06870 [Candidatus Peregrinibacteria bacterium]|nr:hypothetical protein [Candidatus Peregrinibacteria bacterium]
MKRTLLAAGILLTLLSPHAALAAPSPTPTYITAVLNRAQAGIDYAVEGNAVLDFFLYFTDFDWVRQIASTFAAHVDLELLTMQTADLPENTACLHVDIARIDAKIEEVRYLLNRAKESARLITILRLQQLVRWLYERRRMLVLGGTDPEFIDEEWKDLWLFDRVGALCDPLDDDCEFEGGTDMCPFHTNYLPWSKTGYGCGPEAMASLMSSLPVDSPLVLTTTEEKDALETAERGLQEYIAELQVFLSSAADAPALLGISTPTPLTHPSPQYADGCIDDPELLWKDGAIRHELRGPFAFTKPEIPLLRHYLQFKKAEGENRALPDYVEPSANTSAIEAFFTGESQEALEQFSGRQGEQESGLLAAAMDPYLSLNVWHRNPQLPSLRRLANLVKDPEDGLRGFVRDYAYYLRRSCIYRPCNARLDRILKIVLEPSLACFPYTTGSFKADTCANPRWKKCNDAANLGLTIETPVCPPVDTAAPTGLKTYFFEG